MSYPRAVDRTECQNTATMAFIFITVFLDMMSMGIVGPVLPTLIERFTGSSGGAGVISGVFISLWSLAQFVASPVIGALSDQLGRRPVILLSTAGLALDYLIMALAPNLRWLAVGRVIAGLTSATVASASAYTADVTRPEQRTRAFGVIGAAFSTGLIAGPLVGGVLGAWSLRAPFWMSSALSVCALLYGTFVLPESLPVERRIVFSWKRASAEGALKLLRSHRELLGLAGVLFLIYSSALAFSTTFVLYGKFRYSWGPWETGVLLTVFGALGLIVQGTLVGPITRRLGERATLLLGLTLSATGFCGMGFAPSGALFALALLPAALGGLAMPTLQSLMSQLVSASEQGRLQGAASSVTGIAGLVSPPIFGQIYALSVSSSAHELRNSGMTFLIAALLQFIAVFGAGVLFARSAKHTFLEADVALARVRSQVDSGSQERATPPP